MQAAAQDVAANQATAAEELFADVDTLCEQASALLAELVKQVGAAGRPTPAMPVACQQSKVYMLDASSQHRWPTTHTCRRVTRRTVTSCAPPPSSCAWPS